MKNAAKYHFKPGELVSGIITVYLNLGKEQRFCEALPRDGRSFSMDLFSQAEKVLRSVQVAFGEGLRLPRQALVHVHAAHEIKTLRTNSRSVYRG